METDKRYFLVGTFVFFTIIAILLFIIWLSADNRDFVRYQVRFAESVSGLSVGGAVKFRGVNVGSVESITIDQRDTRLIRVIMKVEKRTPIKTDTVASLKLQGITGVVFIELTGGSNNMPSLMSFAESGEVPEIKAQSSPLNAIVDKLPELLDRVSHGVEQFNKVLSDDNVAEMSDMISKWNSISTKLDTDVSKLDPMIKNISDSSQQFQDIMRELKQTSNHINNLAERVDDNPSSLIFPGKEKGVPAP